MRTGSALARNALLLTLGNLAMRGVSMIFQVWLADALGAAGLGLLQLILSVQGFAITLGTSGLRTAATYLSAEEHGLGRSHGVRQAMDRCLLWCLLLSSAVGLCLILAAEPVALGWIRDLQAAPSLRLLGLGLPLVCVGAVLGGCFTACGKVHQWLAVELCDRVLTIALTALLLKQGGSRSLSDACLSIIGGGLLASVLSVTVLYLLMVRFLGPRKKEPLSMNRRLLRFTAPVALNDYLRSGLGTLEQFLIPYGFARWGGSQDLAMASYGTIQGMVFPVLMFPCCLLFSLSELLVPELARCRVRKDDLRRDRITEKCLQLGGLYAAGIAGLLFVLAHPLGLLLYDSPDAGRYLQIFSPMVLMLYLDAITDGMHKGLGQQVYCVRVNTLTNLMDVVLLFLLLPRYGIGGYILTFLVTHGVNFFLSLRRLLQITACRLSLWQTGVTALCVSGAAAVTLTLPRLPGWGGVILSAAVYLSLTALSLVLCSGSSPQRASHKATSNQ